MARLVMSDTTGAITIEVEAEGAVLAAALEHEQAEALIRCAVLLGLSALAEGGGWPAAALRNMAAFMSTMRDEMRNAQIG